MFISFNDRKINKQDCIFYEGSEYFKHSDIIDMNYKDYYNYDPEKLDGIELIDYIKFMDYIGNDILLASSIYEYKKRNMIIPIEIEYIDEFIKYTIDEIFRKCDNLCKEYIKLLIEKGYVFDGNGYKSIDGAFIYSCKNNHKEMAKWILSLDEKLNIYAIIDAFRLSCYYGHKDVAEWIISIDGKVDIRIYNDCAFRWSCLHGHKETVEWLCSLSNGKYNIIDINSKPIKYEILKND